MVRTSREIGTLGLKIYHAPIVSTENHRLFLYIHCIHCNYNQEVGYKDHKSIIGLAGCTLWFVKYVWECPRCKFVCELHVGKSPHRRWSKQDETGSTS